MPTKKFEPPFLRAPGNYDPAVASHESALKAGPPGESLTVQSMAEDADINVLMRKYGILGGMPQNPRVPMYGDFTGVHDYQTALESVGAAMEMFMEYPADVRARFENNPQKFLEFCSDEKNKDEMRKLGFLKPEPPAAVLPVPPVSVSPPAATPPVAPAPAKTV